MDLDKITIAMRPRTHREAMDLGLKFLQNNWRNIYPPLLSLIIPLFILLNLLFSSHMWVTALVIWWLKPLYDRLILFVLSRNLFSETPGTAHVLAALPGLMKKGLIWQLTLFRFSPHRSFTMPVWVLEGLSGESRRQRIQVLNSRTSGYAIWLLVLCWHLELIVLFSFYILILMLLPQTLEMESFLPIFSEVPPYWLEFVGNSFYLLAVLIIEPFYVVAGFMLYINRRNQLEAWDIEIQFRRIAQRLKYIAKKSGVMAASLLMVILVSTHSIDTFAEESSAQEISAIETASIKTTKIKTTEIKTTEIKTSSVPLAAEESKRIITEILSHEDFGTEKEISYWTLKNIEPAEQQNDFSFDFGLGPFLATIIKLILVSLLVIFIIYLFIKARHLVQAESIKKEKINETPEVLFGMNITPDSLPDDIIAEANQLWSNKKYREALGLLYRGSLSILVNEDKILLDSSMTEQGILDCARQAKLENNRIIYLNKLTRSWQSLAYAHRIPEETEIQSLFNEWPIQFSQAQSQ